MFENSVLELVKAREGISTNIRDSYLTSIVKGVIRELQDEKGIALMENDPNHLMFVVDYASWRYNNRDVENMPRHLQYRLHNLIIQYREVTANELE
ncbi:MULTISPECIES: phage head-tail connector protein [Listeria]|uniref:phage head-tail connector protein n=1 Tax=Listeria TaxID=1637 RepID=UPI000B588F1B|nr:MULTISPECIES: phage head-tail connector protein [Listeria]